MLAHKLGPPNIGCWPLHVRISLALAKPTQSLLLWLSSLPQEVSKPFRQLRTVISLETGASCKDSVASCTNYPLMTHQRRGRGPGKWVTLMPPLWSPDAVQPLIAQLGYCCPGVGLPSILPSHS